MTATAQEPAAPLLSVSIVTYHVDLTAFRATLTSLIAAAQCLLASRSGQVRVTLVDNGDQEQALRALAADLAAPGLAFEVLGGFGNLGYGRAHNLAILASQAPWHLILNPDVLLDEDSLSQGLDLLRQRPDIAALAPFALDGEGQVQYLCKNFPSLLDLLLRGFAPAALKRRCAARLARYELRDTTRDETVEGIPLISGCFMLCDTARLKGAGGFDERFFLYFEDYALSLELARQGILVYHPRMRIRHFGGHAARKGLRHILLFASSGIKFFNTYGWKLR